MTGDDVYNSLPPQMKSKLRVYTVLRIEVLIDKLLKFISFMQCSLVRITTFNTFIWAYNENLQKTLNNVLV